MSLGLEIDETQKPHPRQCCGHDINLEFVWGRDYLGETSSLIQLYLVGKNPKKIKQTSGVLCMPQFLVFLFWGSVNLRLNKASFIAQLFVTRTFLVPSSNQCIFKEFLDVNCRMLSKLDDYWVEWNAGDGEKSDKP